MLKISCVCPEKLDKFYTDSFSKYRSLTLPAPSRKRERAAVHKYLKANWY